MSARELPYVAQYSPLTAHRRANRVPDVYLEVQHPCWSCNYSSSSANASAGRIQFVSATLVFGLAAFDCSLAISSSHTSLGVL